MLGQEAVVAVEAPGLVVVLGVHQGGVALPAHKALVVPVALSIINLRHKVILHMHQVVMSTIRQLIDFATIKFTENVQMKGRLVSLCYV